MRADMNEPIEAQGVWWLPETPDHKVPGWFSYDLEEGGTLRLAGSLRPLNWINNVLPDGTTQRFVGHRPDEDRLYPRIHGQSGSRLFHIEDAFQLSLEHGLCREDDAAEKIHVNWLITGALFEGEGKPKINRAVVELQHLTSWVNNDALSLRTDRMPDGVFGIAQASYEPTMKADIGDGLELSLSQALATGGDHRNDLTLNQRIVLNIHANTPRPMNALTDRVSDFQDLLTIAAGRVANIEKFHFTHVDLPKLSMAGTPLGTWKEELGLYTRWANRDSDRERLSPYAMVFTFAQFGGLEGLRKWMRVADVYRSELDRIMATRYNPTMFVEDRVAHCVAALEGFDRTRRSSKDQDTRLVERLRRCVSHAGTPFPDLLGGESVETWTERAKNHRHALGHHLDRFRANTSLVERELGDQLLWLAELCLLREADAPAAVFDRIRESSHFRWVAQRAAASHGGT
jgi:hypothetical protein